MMDHGPYVWSFPVYTSSIHVIESDCRSELIIHDDDNDDDLSGSIHSLHFHAKMHGCRSIMPNCNWDFAFYLVMQAGRQWYYQE